MGDFVLAIDQGTTGSTVALMDSRGKLRASVNHEFPQIYEKDATRQEELEQVGFFVIRFSNKKVLTEMEHVKFAISQCVQEREELLGLKQCWGD